MHNKITTLLICFGLIAPNIGADNTISVYLAHVPENIVDQVTQDAGKEKIEEKIASMNKKSPDYVGRKLANNGIRSLIKPPLSGFIATYGEYTDYSNIDGLICFLKRHAPTKLYLAITPSLKIVNVKGNTISHKEFIPGQEAKLYSYELAQDEKKEFWTWTVKAIPLPTDMKVNPLTLTILTKPHDLYVQEGTFLASENNNLVLPDIFVISNTNATNAILGAMDDLRFFEPINSITKKATETTIQEMPTNL